MIGLNEMIYCNQGAKRDLLNGNLRFYQDGNYVFGAQTVEMNEMTRCNEKPTTFWAAEQKIDLESRKSRFKRSRSNLSVKTCLNHQLKTAVINR